MRFQSIYDIAGICAKKGISNAILCPGSRSAPLTLAFTRHPEIDCKTFSDERSAGFVAIGMAQITKVPAVVVCTSGSAVYNLSPAVAEAFFSETPMIILSADRPKEWIAQHDGQTIFQSEIFGKHVKKYFELPQDYDHPDSQWAINRIVNEAINLSQQEPKGPVHINCPFREPLYPEKGETTSYSDNIRIIHPFNNERPPLSDALKQYISSSFPAFHRILIVIGQHPADASMLNAVAEAHLAHQIPVVADIISNTHELPNTIRHADLFFGQAPEQVKETLQPDLLITVGQSLISKNLKLFLRKYSAKEHWHIGGPGPLTDPFKNVTHVMQCDSGAFFHYLNKLKSASFDGQKQVNYSKLWEIEDRRAERTANQFFENSEWNELTVMNTFLEMLPANANLHLANSMSVRYANFFGLQPGKKNLTVFSNRGTSGIDGCTSTTMGHAFASDKPTFLVTGDVAFFYDRNAFWHNYAYPNLRILLLNNHGGQIFNMIDGPASQPEAQEFFITRQPLQAKSLCSEFDLDHLPLDHPRKMKNVFKDFFTMDGRSKLIEVETNMDANRKAFDELKRKIKMSYEL